MTCVSPYTPTHALNSGDRTPGSELPVHSPPSPRHVTAVSHRRLQKLFSGCQIQGAHESSVQISTCNYLGRTTEASTVHTSQTTKPESRTKSTSGSEVPLHVEKMREGRPKVTRNCHRTFFHCRTKRYARRVPTNCACENSRSSAQFATTRSASANPDHIAVSEHQRAPPPAVLAARRLALLRRRRPY